MISKYTLDNEWGTATWPEINPTETHVIPCGEEHSFLQCNCNPTPDLENPFLIVHNSFDGREAYELGSRKPH